MRIKTVKLNNYVCFYNTPEFELGPGINFVVGKNNSGKTALLDAISHKGKGESHRSVQTMPERDPVVDPTNTTHYEFEYEFNREELLRILIKLSQSENRDNQYFIPVPKSNHARLNEQEEKMKFVSAFLADGFNLRCIFKANEVDVHKTKVKRFDAISVPEGRADVTMQGFSTFNDKTYTPFEELISYDLATSRWHWQLISNHIQENIYKFDAERSVNQHGAEDNLNLESNASNLAQVMDTASRKKSHKYDTLIDLVKHMIPDIREVVVDRVNATPQPSIINLGYYPRSMEREDLRIPLTECGTGLTQVLAMLYVVVVSDNPRIVIIDEPNSFLHPGAVRKLLEIFQKHDHHQYVIATHSPAAIAAVQEKTILHVERKGMRSRVRALNANDTKALGETFRSLGMRPSDYLGVDAIVWVEGTTEKRCFPLILETAGFQLEGVRFIPVAEIGDLTGKSAKKFIAVLERVAKDVGLLPREVICVHDGDKANDLMNADTERDVKVETLSRQNYESYFLDFPEILESLLKENAAEGSPIHEGKSIREWMIENNGGRGLDDAEWLKTVDGATFIHDMFSSLGKIDYKRNKPSYGEEITKRILDKESVHFQEIVDLITSILDKDLHYETT